MADEIKNAPDIRFKGFNKAWGEIKFNDYYKVFAGHAFKYNDYVKDGIPIINGESIQHCKIESTNFKYLPNIFREKYCEFLVKEGDIVIGLNRPITNGQLKLARIPKDLDGSLLYQRAGKINYKIDVGADFSFVLLDKEITKHTLIEAVGSDQPFISTSKLDKWEMLIPTERGEQTQIGSYFQHLDKLISLHQAKVNKLTNLKKAMLEKMFPKAGEDVPEIRFKGFEGAWEKKPLDEIFEYITNNTLSRAQLNYDFGWAKNVHYGDVLIKFGELLDAEKGELPFITDNDLATKYKATKLQNGDVIIADAAEDESVGKCCEVINVGNQIIVAGLHTIAIRPIKSFAPKYLGYFMNANIFHDQLLRLMQGTKVLSISKTAIKETVIFYPSETKEQEQIGNYFQNLDKLITLHQTELQKLNNLKKACLEKMFV